MFPIIPYAVSVRHGDVGTSRRAHVVAECELPRSSRAALDPECLRTKSEDDGTQLKIGLDSDGSLCNKSENSELWIKRVRLSDDCHNFNVRLSMDKCSESQKPKILVEITRTVKPGQELLLWFSEDVLAAFQMAFLTPANIQGQKRYVCSTCSATFEYPNPLKLHLTLNCSRYHISTIWERLATAMSQERSPNARFKFELVNVQKYEAVDLMRIGTPMFQRVSPDLQVTKSRAFSEPRSSHSSAFKPVKKQNNNTIRLSQSLQNFASVSQDPGLLRASYPLVSYSHAAQMETLVSSLGKSKQGHLCIYCGKCYSRKYGLKIHIRTHTGYKPLKCKYCLRPFGDPSNLNKHVRLHAEGETPYKCDLCGKVLVRRRDLERHLKSRHSDGEPFVDNPEHVDTEDQSDD